MDKDFSEKYERQTYDIAELGDTDIKINPDYYIHNALLKAQSTFLKDDMKEGFLQYTLFIEHIEVLCDSANMLGDDYTENLKEYKESKEYKEAENALIKGVRLANKKLGLMMKEVFNKKTITEPLRDKV